MLYVLPPPSGPSPPSPWSLISNSDRNSECEPKHLQRKSRRQSPPALRKHSRSLLKHCRSSKNDCDSGAGSSLEDEETNSVTGSCHRLSECYFASCSETRTMDARASRQQRSRAQKATERRTSLATCASSPNLCSPAASRYASSSAAIVVASPVNATRHNRHHQRQLHRQPFDKKNSSGNDIQQHLQSMFSLLRVDDTLKMAVRLESLHAGRTRYLVVVSGNSTSNEDDACSNQLEECCLLGIDCNESTTIGLVLKVLADTSITLDGDGGFSVSVCGKQHIFKPVSVQAMWSALQTLHKVSTKARESNYFEGGNSHRWASYYEQKTESDRSCLNEWYFMNDLESRRPPSPDSLRSKPLQRQETERVIRSTLKEIMMSVDLDSVTSKHIRSGLEEHLDMDLREFKSFIDEEMLVILGQMDEATEIFPHVYLGSEWNASNIEELNKNQINHILNVTREIDNFFPGTFDYLNVRVYDDDNTDLLKHWDNTYKYINKVKKEGSKVLVHCKMGISRSASVVIAYAMKAFNWELSKAFEYVQKKRSCIKPNKNFINQLETYQGILDAMKNKEKLQRSKSETNLKHQETSSNSSTKSLRHSLMSASVAVANAASDSTNRESNDTTDVSDGYSSASVDDPGLLRVSGTELTRLATRPKSWSPDNLTVSALFSSTGTMSQSLEQLSVGGTEEEGDQVGDESRSSSSASSLSGSPPRQNALAVTIPPAPPLPPPPSRYNLNVRMPCANGLAYSVSQNKIVQLYQNSDNRKQPPDCGLQRVAENGRSADSSSQLEHDATVAQRIDTLSAHRGLEKEQNRGIVSNLKKEFEAKSAPVKGFDNATKSLPSSPVIEHTSHIKVSRSVSPSTSAEDLSVRKLVVKYEVGEKGGASRIPQPPVPPRKSSLTAPRRAPTKSLASPAYELRATVAKAANRVQQGKTHPLSRLPFCKRVPPPTPPVFNTM